MGSFFFQPTAEVFTGNPATVNDLYNATPPFTGYPYPNGARNVPGRSVYMYTGTTLNTYCCYRYVRYNPTATVTLVAGQLPPVYWVDVAQTTVSPTASEGIAGVNGIAGVLLNMKVTAGNWTYIQVSGYLVGMISNTGCVAGSVATGNATALTVTITAAGTAPPARPLYIATSSIVSSVCNGIVTVENMW
jgi:hypothetical protein